jgi:hypothetical protein
VFGFLRIRLSVVAERQSDSGRSRAMERLHGACMDETGIEVRALKPLRQYVFAIIDLIQKPPDVAWAIATLHRAGVDALFEF